MTSAFSMLYDESKDKKRGGTTGKTAKPKMKMARSKSVRLKSSGRRSSGTSARRFSPRTPRPNAIVKARYVKNNGDARRHIIQHIDYLKDRSKKPWEERKFFDRENVDLDRDEIIKKMLASKGKDIAMYKLILSPGDNSVNLKDYTRDTMDRLEANLGYKVDWIAMDQYNTEHYHSHVIVPGKIPEQHPIESGKDKDIDRYIENWSKFKEGKDLKLVKNNLQAMREAGNDFIYRDRSIDRELDLSIEREFGLDNWSQNKLLKERFDLDVWEQDRSVEDKELGLEFSFPEYKKFCELANVDRDYDRKIAYELGLSKHYDLGPDFHKLPVKEREESLATSAYDLSHEERAERDTKLFRHLGDELQKLGESSSFDQYGKFEDKDKDRSDGLANLVLSMSNRQDTDRVQEYAGNGFYEPRQDDSSGQEFETFDSGMFDSQDRDDREDDQFSQQQPQGG